LGRRLEVVALFLLFLGNVGTNAASKNLIHRFGEDNVDLDVGYFWNFAGLGYCALGSITVFTPARVPQ
jgi:hypothetical protein